MGVMSESTEEKESTQFPFGLKFRKKIVYIYKRTTCVKKLIDMGTTMLYKLFLQSRITLVVDISNSSQTLTISWPISTYIHTLTRGYPFLHGQVTLPNLIGNNYSISKIAILNIVQIISSLKSLRTPLFIMCLYLIWTLFYIACILSPD